MFSLQATATQNAELTQRPQEAMSRLTAVARIHERASTAPPTWHR